MTDICVVGVGNVLMGDDGLGPYAVRQLEADWCLPERVRAIDAGTFGLDLVSIIGGLDALFVLDAVRGPGAPGQVQVFERQEVAAHTVALRGPHDLNVSEALRILDLLGGAPQRVTVIGVVAARISSGVGLSAPVLAALPRVEAMLLERLAALGVPLAARVPSLEPDIWWERKS